MFAAISCAHAQLIVNGGFESPTIPEGSGEDWVHVTGTDLTGWSVSSQRGAVLFVEPLSPVAFGKQAVEIEVPGDSLSQSFVTTAGTDYRLSFDMSAFAYYGGPGRGSAPCPCTSVVDVSIGSVDATFWSNSDGWLARTLDFTADSDLTTLTFTSPVNPEGYGNYPHLDNVSVVQTERAFVEVSPVPEPETYALILGGLALLRWRTRSSSARRV